MINKANDPKGEAGNKKCPLGLIPPSAMEETAWVHRLGSEKYGPFNWRETGVCASTYIHAIMRHLNAWRDGKDLDPESGRTHLAHIACCCNILMDASACGKLDDDRNKIGYGSPEVEVEGPTTQGPYAGYRMLDKGEILQKGDVVYHASWGPMDARSILLSDREAGNAIAFSSSGPYPHGYYFRPVQNDKQPTTKP